MSSFTRTIEYLQGEALMERTGSVEFICIDQARDELGRPLFFCRPTWRCEL